MITLKMASPRSAVTLPAPLQEVRRLDLPMPAGLILISPWLDATMSAPEQAQLEAHDPVLRRAGGVPPRKQTSGAFGLLQGTMSPGAVTAPHSHTHEEETPYVLEGTLQVETQGKTITLTAGQTATLPRNVPHRLSNPTSGITRILMLCTPAGFDSYLKEIGEPVDDPTAPPAPMTEAQISRLVKVAGRYGISMVDQAEL